MTLLDFLFPPVCIACRQEVGEAGGFCAACWAAVTFLDGPGCACCGVPFAADAGPDTLCAACLAKPPAYACARAILAYDDHSRAPILGLKHADRLELVPGFARWLARTGADIIAASDVIVPVPLHRSRLWRRRYNQAAELARALSRHTGKPAMLMALVRTRATKSQGEMVSAKARRRNVLSTFQVPDAARIAGRNVLVVDDVLTTGATADATARALKRAGAREVRILALARVVRAAEGLI